MWENIGVVLVMIGWLAFVVGLLILWFKVIAPHRAKTFAKVEIERKIREQRARDRAAAEVMAKYERKGRL